MDRVVARSLDSTELHEVKAASEHEMKKNLNWWDLMWFGLEARDHAGPAVVLSYVVSGVSAMLSVFCYTEFAVEIPVAGGSFAYLRVELGDFLAFIAAGNILFEYAVSGAAVARAWTSYFATLLNHRPDDFRIIAHSLPTDYNHLDPIAVVITAVICILAVLSTKGSSRFNYIASIFHVVIILFIIVAGIFVSAAVLFFAYVGFDAVSTMAEETKNPGRDIPIGLVGSMAVTTVAYCLGQIDPDAPFSVAFEAVGWKWAKYIVAAGALKGMTTVLLVSAVGQARYLTHIARTHMMPPWLAHVNAKTGTPVNATVVMGAGTAVIALFTKLDILSNLLSISTLIIFMMVALALLVRRYYVTGVTTGGDHLKLIGCIVGILGSAVGTAVLWGLESGWVGYVVTVGIWVVATAVLAFAVPQARQPKMWGVPLVPWLPSASIMINIFLLGSIDKASFGRFGIWTALLLVYYLLFGMHATYDVAKELEEKRKVENGASKIEEGISG
ncbi:Cationic amino acid transporter 1 [Linum grandiflorum]